MSYILDALKRADAERERVGVPGLHAQPDAAADLAREPKPRRWAGRMGFGLLLALGLAALAWLWPAAPDTEPSVATGPPAATAPPPAPKPLVAPVAQPEPAPPPVAAPSPEPAVAAAPKPRAEPAPSTSAATDRARPTALADLPADVRRALPALTVGGSMYSANAAQRMVILNGQVFREGDPLAEGLSVEQIGLRSTVLAFRGYRIELKH